MKVKEKDTTLLWTTSSATLTVNSAIGKVKVVNT